MNHLPVKYLLIVCLFIVSLSASAQDCTEASILQKPGVWKEGMKGSITGITAADLDKREKLLQQYIYW